MRRETKTKLLIGLVNVLGLIKIYELTKPNEASSNHIVDALNASLDSYKDLLRYSIKENERYLVEFNKDYTNMVKHALNLTSMTDDVFKRYQFS